MKLLIKLSMALIIGAGFISAEKTVYVPLTPFTAVAASKGWLKEEFDKIGAKYEVVDITNLRLAGAEGALLERGQINFASRMSYPAFMHKLNGLDMVVIRANQRVDSNAVSLFVLSDSPIKSVSDLRGKTVGTVRYHCGFAGALDIFNHAGIPLKTDNNPAGVVNWWNSPGYYQLQQGLLSGRLDAVVDHAIVATYAAPILQGQFRVIADLPKGGLYQTYASRSFHFSLRSWAEKNPDAIKAYLITLEKARLYILSHHEEVIPIIAKQTRTPASVVRFTIESPYAISWAPAEAEADSVVETLVGFQKAFANAKDPLIAKKQLTREQLNAFVDKRFFRGGQYSIVN